MIERLFTFTGKKPEDRTQATGMLNNELLDYDKPISVEILNFSVVTLVLTVYSLIN